MIEDMVFKSFHMNSNSKIIAKETKNKVEQINPCKNSKNDTKYNVFQNNDDKYNIQRRKRNEEINMDYDTCEISEEAMKLYEMARKAVDNVPDIREDKVKEIKNKIKDGTYNISAEELADKLMK